MRIAALLGILTLASHAHAQRTWIVDAAGGAGHDFTDLPPALAAAGHGDQILLRPGIYRGATTDRGVTILGTNAQLTTTLRVTGLALGRTFALVGVGNTAAPLVFASPVECTGNAGRLHFDRVLLSTPGPTWGNAGYPGLRLDRCRAVTATGCSFVGSPGLRATASKVVLTACTSQGHAAAQINEFWFRGAPGVAVDTVSTLHAARCRISGGAGAMGFGPLAPGAAITAADSDLTLTGDATEGLRAGAAVGTLGAAAIVADGGTLTLDPTLPLLPTGNSAPIAGVQRARLVRRLPALSGQGAPPGGLLRTELYSPAGQVAALFMSTASDPTPTPFGALWLEPARVLVVDVGVQGASEHRAVSIPVPNVQALGGSVLALQTLSGDAAQLRFEFTNVAVVAIH